MSIVIQKDLCVGCGKCQKVCPGSLIKADESNKAYIKYPKDCWGCSSCLKECSQNAIQFYLGADIGGRASKMAVKQDKEFIHWIVEKNDGSVIKIDINKQDANQY